MDQPNLCRQHYCSLSRKVGNFSEGTISNACEHVNHPIERETTSNYSTRKPRLKLSAGLQTPLPTWEFRTNSRLRGSRVRGPGLSSWPSSGTPLGSGWLRFGNQPGWAKPWIVHGWQIKTADLREINGEAITSRKFHKCARPITFICVQRIEFDREMQVRFVRTNEGCLTFGSRSP